MGGNKVPEHSKFGLLVGMRRLNGTHRRLLLLLLLLLLRSRERERE